MHLKCYHSNYYSNNTCQIRRVIFRDTAEEIVFSLMKLITATNLEHHYYYCLNKDTFN